MRPNPNPAPLTPGQQAIIDAIPVAPRHHFICGGHCGVLWICSRCQVQLGSCLSVDDAGRCFNCERDEDATVSTVDELRALRDVGAFSTERR